MIAEIVAVGTELLMGQVLNTDAQFIARRLSEAGITLHRQIVVGDNPERIRQAVRDAHCPRGPRYHDRRPGAHGGRYHQTGVRAGAGPCDGAQAGSGGDGARLVCQKNGREMTENNLRQADFAKGARIMPMRTGRRPPASSKRTARPSSTCPGRPTSLRAFLTARSCPIWRSAVGGHRLALPAHFRHGRIQRGQPPARSDGDVRKPGPLRPTAPRERCSCG